MDFKFKNDYLNHFTNELQHRVKNKNTRKNYIYEINKAFRNQEFDSIDQFDYEKLKDYFSKIKTKRSASALKCSLKHFSKVFTDFRYHVYERNFRKEVKKKSARRSKKWKSFKLSTALRKINSIGDKKLKLGYRTIFASGLRVEELSDLKKRDLLFKDGKLLVSVEDGKYGKKRVVETIKDSYLEKSLKEYTKMLKDDDRLFYKVDHIISKASENGFMSHDLRRAFSKIIFNSFYKKGDSDSKEKAISEVKKRLGHEKNTTTYKKYLSRKVDFDKTKWKSII